MEDNSEINKESKPNQNQLLNQNKDYSPVTQDEEEEISKEKEKGILKINPKESLSQMDFDMINKNIPGTPLNTEEFKREPKIFSFAYLIYSAFVIFFDIPFLIILYYFLFYSNCGSPLDPKMNILMGIFSFFVLSDFIMTMMNKFTNNNLGFCGKILMSFLCYTSLILLIYSVIIMQGGYNTLTEWPNCGYFRGMIHLLLLLYKITFWTLFVIIFLLACGFTILYCMAICDKENNTQETEE